MHSLNFYVYEPPPRFLSRISIYYHKGDHMYLFTMDSCGRLPTTFGGSSSISIGIVHIRNFIMVIKLTVNKVQTMPYFKVILSYCHALTGTNTNSSSIIGSTILSSIPLFFMFSSLSSSLPRLDYGTSYPTSLHYGSFAFVTSSKLPPPPSLA